MKNENVTSLGLRSLREVSAGRVYITENRRLCYLHTVQWTALSRRRADLDIRNNKPRSKCRELGRGWGPWGPSAGDPGDVTLSPLPSLQSKRGRCVTRCAPPRAAGVPAPLSACPAVTTAAAASACRRAASPRGEGVWGWGGLPWQGDTDVGLAPWRASG